VPGLNLNESNGAEQSHLVQKRSTWMECGSHRLHWLLQHLETHTFSDKSTVISHTQMMILSKLLHYY